MRVMKKLALILLVFSLLGCKTSEYYIVKEGESIYAVSVKTKVSVGKLMSLNNMSVPKISEGQTLLIK